MTLAFSTHINGQPNYFIEKIWESIFRNNLVPEPDTEQSNYIQAYQEKFGGEWDCKDPYKRMVYTKDHTIRADPHGLWKPGMLIHPVIHNRTPNRFQFAPTIPCTAVQTIVISMDEIKVDGKRQTARCCDMIAQRDGFDNIRAFVEYFNGSFSGKLIHWTNHHY